ncbi:DNA-binding protein [Prauserella marina]|nr:cold shock domain-containing protein [Prauserella marina]ASR35003.1 DNA-binding protein [Prauserella marina]
MGFGVVAGKVVRFDEFRGYGFVAPDTGGEDVFIHVNDLDFDKRLLGMGARVEFDIEDGDRGLKASRVQILEQAVAEPQARQFAHRAESSSDEDGLCDVLSAREYLSELTETLLTAEPTLTAQQIVRIRQNLTEVARGHGWVES